MKTKWKPIPEFIDFYEVSDTGKVRSLPRNGTIKKAKILKPDINITTGYHQVKLCKNGFKKVYKIHRLVAKTFIENPNNKPEVNHKDGKKGNNRVDNLEWCTKSENSIHAVKNHLTNPQTGERCSWSKLTQKQVEEIRKKYKPFEYSLYKLAKEYGVTHMTIYAIILGKSWRYAYQLKK